MVKQVRAINKTVLLFEVNNHNTAVMVLYEKSHNSLIKYLKETE